MKKNNWRRFLPNLGFSLELPFIRISVRVLYQRWESDTVEWFRVYWNVWKWSGDFNLYWKPTGY